MNRAFLCLFLIVYPAAAVADVMITCERVGDLSEGIIQVNYNATDDANLPRAFGLDITVDAGTITEIVTGSESEDYWIYPGTIDINGITGTIYDPGLLVAPNTDPGALGGIGTSGMTVEMGSLYNDPCDPEHQDPPALAGILFQFKVSENCQITIAENNTRGGVVLENGEQASTNLPLTVPTSPKCYDAMADYAEWEAVGEPECWCYPRQCHGDVDGFSESKSSYYVLSTDLGVFLAAWNKTLPQIAGQTYNGIELICADYDHASESKSSYRVLSGDLGVLLTYWNQPPANVPPDCQPGTIDPENP